MAPEMLNQNSRERPATPREFRAGELGGPIAARKNDARALLENLAGGRNMNVFQLFCADMTVRKEVLFEFCQEAQKLGYAASDVAWTIFSSRYPAKLANYQTTSANQSAGEIVLAGTAKVNWFEMLEGAPIVENDALLNGTFGRKLTCISNDDHKVLNELADTAYLIDHDQHANLPQAPWIVFGEKTRGVEEFDGAVERALHHRTQFKKEVPGKVGNVVGGNHLKISDRAHKGTTKFRLACMVFDCESGILWVVSDKKDENGKPLPPAKFSTWAKDPTTLCDILSCSPAELERIRQEVALIGLSKKLATPGGEGYRPWAELAGRVKAQMQEENGSGEGWYKKANQLWRYALIARQIANVEKYEAVWRYIRGVQETLASVIKIACDDGRQHGDAKVLGAMLTQEEFGQLILANHSPEGLVFAPHYGCGFLSAAYEIHMQFKRVRKALNAGLMDSGESGEFSEFERSMDYFKGLVSAIGGNYGPVTERNMLNEYIPKALAEDLKLEARKILEGEDSVPADAPVSKNQHLVKFLFDVLIYQKEMMREVVRRGLNVGVFKLDSDGLPFMPAVDKVENRIELFLENGAQISEPRKKALVFEQVARYKKRQYEDWMARMPQERRVKIETYMDNFVTGQATEIPPKPTSAAELLDFARKDFVLNNPRFYAPQDVAELGMGDRLTWTIPE